MRFAVTCLLLALIILPSHADNSLKLQWDKDNHHLSLQLDELSLWQSGILTATVNGAFWRSDTQTQVTCEKNTLHFPNGLRFTIALEDNLLHWNITGENIADIHLSATVLSPNAAPARLIHEQSEDHQMLLNVLGEGVVPGIRSIFDPTTDATITLMGETDRWQWHDGWVFESDGQDGSMRLDQHYCRDTLGIEYYAPRLEQPAYPAAPAVALTWFGIEGWENRQTHEWLFPQIDWVAQNLLPYAGNMIFQVDDHYPYDDDAYMRAISDYIRAKGLTPGIWFTPHGVAAPEIAEEHPDWFLQDAEGNLLNAFAGVNWRDPSRPGPDNYVINTSHPEAREEVFGAFWKKAAATWNFDYFKIDAQPTVANRYKIAANSDGIAGYRDGLAYAREIVGPDKYISGCYGIPLDAMGFVNGSRTGADSGTWTHAMEVILRWNFLNRHVWWCDPDAAAYLYREPLHNAQFRIQARALTGQAFLTDDVWTDIPPESIRVLQQGLPTLPITPVNLYPIRKGWTKYDGIDLRINKPWGSWNVVGLFNYYAKAKDRELDLSRIALDAERVHVYEYWTDTYYGKFPANAILPYTIEGHSALLFAIHPVPKEDRPIWLASDRHLSLGGLAMENLIWGKTAEGWRVSGSLTHMVNQVPLTLIFTKGAITHATAKGASTSITKTNDCSYVRFIPEKGGAIPWQIKF